MRLLKGSFPDIWQKVLAIEKKLDKDLLEVLPAHDGNMTLKLGNQFIHDHNQCLQEAKNTIDKQKNVEEHADILFYGIGLGYHIHVFVEQYPHTAFTLYESVPEVFCQFLHHVDLSKIPRHLIKNIYLESEPEDLINFCATFVNTLRSSVLVIDLPSYQNIFPQKRQIFFREFENQINEKRNSLATVSAFEKRWTLNSSKNLMQVLGSPNVLLEKAGFFKNKPALLVASGPSVAEEIENLRKIKDEGLAYIFSVGTALNFLLQHDIYPDAACSYDPTAENQIVCKEVLEKGIKSIPLIFGSTVGYETLETYPGPKAHMLISQDTLAAFYCKPVNGERLEFIMDASTIAVIALQLLGKLGFNPIILVGQNLAYKDGHTYASGATYHPAQTSEQDLSNAVMVKDVNGKEIPSNPTFVRMRQQLEFYLHHHQEWQVINTTQCGAHIEGTKYQSLEQLIPERLQERVVADKWLESAECSYDLEYLHAQSLTMDAAFTKVTQLLEKCKRNLQNISQLMECGDPLAIGRSYDMFNESMDNLRNNQFFASFITPMNRVALESLILAVPAVSAETDPIRKAQMMEKEFQPYLINCEQDIYRLKPTYQEISKSIKNFYAIRSVRKKSAQIKILLIDGVEILTDGTIYYSSTGDEFQKFHLKDRTGILALHAKGIPTFIISPEKDSLTETVASKMGIQARYSKLDSLREIIDRIRHTYEVDYNEIACILNDVRDWDTFRQLGLRFALNNTPLDLQEEVDYVLPLGGGEGAVMAVAQLIITDK